MATLTFYGAKAGVTGSAYLLETATARVLLECGLLQGGREEEKANAKPFPFAIESLDAVVLSHAHLDHSGRPPMPAITSSSPRQATSGNGPGSTSCTATRKRKRPCRPVSGKRVGRQK
jgi:ribonuclease BN (tRNA processing enzyme)